MFQIFNRLHLICYHTQGLVRVIWMICFPKLVWNISIYWVWIILTFMSQFISIDGILQEPVLTTCWQPPKGLKARLPTMTWFWSAKPQLWESRTKVKPALWPALGYTELASPLSRLCLGGKPQGCPSWKYLGNNYFVGKFDQQSALNFSFQLGGHNFLSVCWRIVVISWIVEMEYQQIKRVDLGVLKMRSKSRFNHWFHTDENTPVQGLVYQRINGAFSALIWSLED